MGEFYVTFGQQYAYESHPMLDVAHPDGWITIMAPDEETAREWVFEHIGREWAFMYDASDFQPGFFPRGELARSSTDGNIR